MLSVGFGDHIIHPRRVPGPRNLWLNYWEEFPKYGFLFWMMEWELRQGGVRLLHSEDVGYTQSDLDLLLGRRLTACLFDDIESTISLVFDDIELAGCWFDYEPFVRPGDPPDAEDAEELLAWCLDNQATLDDIIVTVTGRMLKTKMKGPHKPRMPWKPR